MRLNLFFLAMEALTMLSYPFLYVYSKLHQWTRLVKSHAIQARP
ncbi:MAG TPA: hypothetical protein VJ987_03175 [Anaerolineales bacterium]|nr:hypothetical protein [Anaerolineales bacterium]